MRQTFSIALVLISLLTPTALANTQPSFINGMVIDRGTLDATGAPGANEATRDVSVPANFHLIPGVLHSYRVVEGDLEGYVAPDN